jgi:cobalt-zinc-cadmium efflux system outer membrane protein
MRIFWLMLVLLWSTLLSRVASAAAFPTLEGTVARARERGPAARLAAAELKVAGSTRHAAGLPPLTNPYLEVFVDRATTHGPATVQGNLWLPIELSGQGSARVGEVDALVAWKTSALSAAAADAVGEAVSAWGEVIVARARQKHAAAGEAIAKEEAAYVNARFEAKDATAADLALAKGEVARWIQSKAEADVAYAVARARLSIAIGDPDLEDPTTDHAVSLPVLRWKDGDALAKHLAVASPVLKAGSLEAAAFLASKKKWEREAWAPVNVIVSLGRSDAGDIRVGGGLAWTFPVLRKNQGEIARAEADAERAEQARAIMAATIAARAKGFVAAYDVARKALQTIDEIAIPASESVVDASLAAWKAGKLDPSRVFLARRDLALARDRRLDLAAAAFRAYAELASLLGDLP